MFYLYIFRPYYIKMVMKFSFHTQKKMFDYRTKGHPKRNTHSAVENVPAVNASGWHIKHLWLLIATVGKKYTFFFQNRNAYFWRCLIVTVVYTNMKTTFRIVVVVRGKELTRKSFTEKNAVLISIPPCIATNTPDALVIGSNKKAARKNYLCWSKSQRKVKQAVAIALFLHRIDGNRQQ